MGKKIEKRRKTEEVSKVFGKQEYKCIFHYNDKADKTCEEVVQ
jgi:predicted urease superfamily metal-dependent hydrolase